MPSLNERVYTLVRHIPPGKVLSYGRVAALLEVPNGARAVGWALAALKAGTDVPWHRVINSAGRISLRGYPDGEQRQRQLLTAEGVRFDEANPLKVADLDGIMWKPSPWEVQDILERSRTG